MADEQKALRDEQGRWLPGHKPANMITPETSHAMLEKRKLKRQLCEEGAERGVIAAAAQVVDRPIASAEEAHEVLAEAVTAGGLTACERGQMRDAVAGIGYGLKLAGQAPAEERSSVNVAVLPMLPVSSAGLAWLRQLVATAAGQIVEGVVLRED